MKFNNIQGEYFDIANTKIRLSKVLDAVTSTKWFLNVVECEDPVFGII
jgi:hypothetical protein